MINAQKFVENGKQVWQHDEEFEGYTMRRKIVQQADGTLWHTYQDATRARKGNPQRGKESQPYFREICQKIEAAI